MTLFQFALPLVAVKYPVSLAPFDSRWKVDPVVEPDMLFGSEWLEVEWVDAPFVLAEMMEHVPFGDRSAEKFEEEVMD